MIGTNQNAQADLFLYPVQTAKQNNPGTIAKLPKKEYNAKVMIKESMNRTKEVRLCSESIGLELRGLEPARTISSASAIF